MRFLDLAGGLLLVSGAVQPALAVPAKTAVPARKAAPPRKLAEGDVTRAQLMAEVKQVFAKADTDKDGFMSRAEFRVRMGAVLNRTPPGTPGAPTKEEAQRMLDAANAAFNAVDANGDGKLSLSETSRRPLAAFDMMDTNHDGILTVAEKMAAHEPAAPGADAPVATPPVKKAPKG